MKKNLKLVISFICLFSSSVKASTVSIDLQKCRDNISNVVCLVEESDSVEVASCLDEGDKYVSLFEELFDAYPAYLQRVFCSLKTINIERKSFGSAYASVVEDENGNINGAIMGIKESLLNNSDIDFDLWSSWKEQLSFGGYKEYKLKKDLPTFSSTKSLKVNSFLYFVIAHEFGHIIDFSNDLNNFICHPPIKNLKNCPPAPFSWGEISWEKELHYIPDDINEFGTIEGVPLKENRFLDWKKLCFYTCNKGDYIIESNINKLYQEMFSGSFISTYSSTNPHEDFAESLAYYTIFEHSDFEVVLDTGQCQTIDIKEYFYSDKFKKKREWI